MSTTTNSLNILSSSSTEQLLAYSEFVSFTPTISGSTTAGVGTYTTQVGRYTKIGKLVFIETNLTWTAHTGTGNMLLTALPFTVRNQANYLPYAPTVNLINAALGAGVAYIVCQFTLNTTQGALLGIRNNNTNLATALDTAATLQVSGWYVT